MGEKVSVARDVRTLTYPEAKQISDMLTDEVSAASVALKKFPRLSNGLVPDEVRATSEYKAAKSTSDRAFSELRAFNGFYVKKFKREIQEDHRKKYARR